MYMNHMCMSSPLLEHSFRALRAALIKTRSLIYIPLSRSKSKVKGEGCNLNCGTKMDVSPSVLRGKVLENHKEMEQADLSIILLGKTGSGKSASGNSILGSDLFHSEKSSESITQEIQRGSVTIGRVRLAVYDTPGLCNTVRSNEEILNKWRTLLQSDTSVASVFILVIKADRLTREERKTIQNVEEFLGGGLLQKTWILFTRADELEDDGMTIEEFIEETEELKKLVQKFGGRYHVFNNKGKNEHQVKTLIEKLQRAVQTAEDMKPLSNTSLTMNSAPSERTKLCSDKTDRAAVSARNTASTAVSKTCADMNNNVPEGGPGQHGSLPKRKILLLGKTGAGKSATGNTILGERKFTSKQSFASVTKESEIQESQVAGRNVSVIDTPGFFDTDLPQERMAKELGRSFHLSETGPHAFLIVLSVGDRYTEKDKEIIERCQKVFGKDMTKYTIIVFTHGERLKGKSKERKREELKRLIDQSPALKSLVEQCGQRYHVFNNADTENRDQVNELLEETDRMVEKNGGSHYTNEMFQKGTRFSFKEYINIFWAWLKNAVICLILSITQTLSGDFNDSSLSVAVPHHGDMLMARPLLS